ncbi:FAS1 domain-containing protein [Chaetomium fimeti]|uniref:FAS1 domain-containing protein n=1 Tax=Chaetomium fimeti TaxID=1854472 RepID=A0AAE0HIE8_9PEZI|nr:FAS1 domain-containing protein [Chaetomium fimeti]
MFFLWFFFMLAAAAVARAQTLEEVLTAHSDTLSMMLMWLASQEFIFECLSEAKGITLLAPSNTALARLFGTSLPARLASDMNLLTAFVNYHILDGVYHMADFVSARTTSAPTFLSIPAYSNMSEVQVIQERSENGTLTFFTGGGAQSIDLDFTGGTLHVIDSVLMVPGRVTDTLVVAGYTAAVGALRLANIDGPLDALSNMTVFVPNNEAFIAIGSAISYMTIEQLTIVLNYHFVRGRVLRSQLITTGTQRSAQGAVLNFRVENGALFVNSARVIATDLLVKNGVVHILDGVLNPANATATPDPNAATQAPAFNGLTTTTCGVSFTAPVVPTTTVSTNAVPTATASSPTTPTPTLVRGDAAQARRALGVTVVCGLAQYDHYV